MNEEIAAAMELPWKTDFEIDAELVRQVVTSQFPQVTAASVSFLGAGWDYHAFEVDSKWVFRFPKRKEVEPTLSTEIAALRNLQGRLSIPAPDYRFIGRSSAVFPCQFGGYAKLPGEPLLALDLAPDAMHRLVPRLGAFLTELHGISEADAVPVCDFSFTEARHEALENLHVVASALEDRLLREAVDFLQDESRIPAPHDGPPRLLHNDLGMEHILVDPKRGEITGVIDWSDTCRGDPAADFVGFCLWQGGAFTEEVISAYSLPVDSGMRDRVRYRSVWAAIDTVYYGVGTGEAVYTKLGVAGLRKALNA